MKTEELETVHADLMSEVLENSRSTGVLKQEAFTQLMIDLLNDLGTTNNPEVCFVRKKLGRGIGRVNAYAIDEEEARLDLITTVFYSEEKPVTLTQKELGDAVVQATRVFSFARGKGFEQLDPSSQERVMFERLHNAYTDIVTLRVIVLTNAVAPKIARKPNLPESEADAVVECYDLVRFSRLQGASTPVEAISIDLADFPCGPIQCLKTPDDRADYDSYLAILPGTFLHEIYEQYGARLMELNVRSFLQNRGKVNRGIRDTLLSEPHRFMAYNNGISATAQAIEIRETTEGIVITRLEGLQVVNGGQTVASIHRAAKIDRADLSGVYVQSKISVVGGELVEELVPRISRFANTQNKVNEADFSANNPFHVEMEQLSRRVWSPGERSRWFYERARGQYDVARAREGKTPAQRKQFDATNPKSQRFTKTDLARYLAAWGEKPHLVSLGAQKNFVSFMRDLESRGDSWQPDQDYFRQCVATGILYRTAESIARRLAFPAYRANAVCYAVAYLAYRTGGGLNLEQLWNEQAAPDVVADQLRTWMPDIHAEIVKSSAGKNVTEWAKKESCWHTIQSLDLPMLRGLETMLGTDVSARATGEQFSQEEREMAARVMALSGEQWLTIFSWGHRTKQLDDRQCLVAQQLAVAASSGWRPLPAGAQIRMGAEMLEAAQSFLTIEAA